MRARLPTTFALALAVGLLLASPGCSRTGAKVQSGIDLYERGAYEGALLRFRDVGPEEEHLRTKTRARYLVYRGLAHWHRSRDARASSEAQQHEKDARSFLRDALDLLAREDADPKWIPADVRRELDEATAQLGLADRPAQPVPAPTVAVPPTPSAAPPTPPTPTPPSTDPGGPSAPSPGPVPSAPPPTIAPPAGPPPGDPIPPSAVPPPAVPL